MSEEKHGINPGLPAEVTQNIPEAPKEAKRRGMDGYDVEVAGSMVASDPPSSTMPRGEDDAESSPEKER